MKEKASEYVNRMVGLPWLRGSDNPANGGLDCWGAVVDSYRCIEGVELPTPSNREACDFSESLDGSISDYQELGVVMEGAIFACYNADSVMIHIGRILAGRAFHAVGSVDNPQSVCTWSIDVLRRYYSSLGCTIKYYKYKG
jgi:hypothetical protein